MEKSDGKKARDGAPTRPNREVIDLSDSLEIARIVIDFLRLRNRPLPALRKI